jgi:hypothetical protein
MSDQNPQDSSVVTIDAGQQNDQGSKVNDAWKLATGAVTEPAKPLRAEEKPPLAENRMFLYGAIGATIGIAAGLLIASLSVHASPSSVAAASSTSNSKASALASMVKPQPVVPADANTPPSGLAGAQTPPELPTKPASHRKAKKKDQDGPARFAIEGDDELVGYDPAKGVIQTSARKTFLISRTTVAGNSSAWQDEPANIHYKCDLNSSCTLTRRGASALYAQLKK